MCDTRQRSSSGQRFQLLRFLSNFIMGQNLKKNAEIDLNCTFQVMSKVLNKNIYFVHCLESLMNSKNLFILKIYLHPNKCVCV